MYLMYINVCLNAVALNPDEGQCVKNTSVNKSLYLALCLSLSLSLSGRLSLCLSLSLCLLGSFYFSLLFFVCYFCLH